VSGQELPRGLGQAVLRGQIRQQPEDFQVDEMLSFAAEGAGEHLFLRVEKRGANTAWVAAQLARWAGVKDMAVGYAGLKDRHAVTRQTFSIHLPGRQAPDVFPVSDEFRVLDAQRHGRKLQRGALDGNRFTLLVRDVQGDHAAIEDRLLAIRRRGVPNYFGEQRFGREGGNLERARGLFAGRRMRRDQASILLSAARSALFNHVLAARVEAGCWDRPVEGEVWVLDGSRSLFGPVPEDDDIRLRCAGMDIHPSACLWGTGPLRSESVSRDFDLLARELGEDLLAGLEAAGLRQERRACRLPVRGMQWDWEGQDCLRLAFALPAGCYATSVLHELGLTESAVGAIFRKQGVDEQE